MNRISPQLGVHVEKPHGIGFYSCLDIVTRFLELSPNNSLKKKSSFSYEPI